MDLKDLTRVMADAAAVIGRELVKHMDVMARDLDRKFKVDGIGQNVSVNSVSFALDILLTEMAAKATGLDRHELFKEISLKHQKVIQEIMGEYSKSGIAIMVDLSPEAKKESPKEEENHGL